VNQQLEIKHGMENKQTRMQLPIVEIKKEVGLM
jgi:hypothetical protein